MRCLNSLTKDFCENKSVRKVTRKKGHQIKSKYSNYISGRESLFPTSLYPVEDWNLFDDSVNVEDFSKLCEYNCDEEHVDFPDD